MSYLKDRLLSIQNIQENGKHTNPLDLNREDLPICHCLNCETDFKGKYCPNCAQKANTSRLTWKHAFEHTLGAFTNLERGFIHTCLDLFYRPGYLIRDYLNGRRADYNKPLSMLFVLATMHLIIHYIFYQNSGLSEVNVDPSTQINVDNDSLKHAIEVLINIGNYLGSNQGLMTLVFVLFLVFPNWLVFKMTRYGKTLNIIEHFYIMLFVGCQLMIFNIIQIPYNRFFSGEDNVFVFSSIYSVLFSAWDVKQLFQIGWWKSFLFMWLSFIVAIIILVILITIAVFTYIEVFNPELKTYLND